MSQPLERANGVWSSDRRRLTFGIVLAVSLIAFEALAVVTIAPEITAQLGGRAMYGWLFSGFFLASILGTVLAGQQSDRYGPRRCLSFGLPLLALGLLLSGLAPSMTWLLVGRALQGFGSGVVLTALYVAVNLAYDDSVRSRMYALMSSAWVAPALVGPLAAGYVATVASWRWVFLGLVPLALLALLALVPSLPATQYRSARSENRLPAAIRLVFGTGLLLASLSQAFAILSVTLALVGLGVAASGLKPLLPTGTPTLARGLPASIIVHGFVFAAFSTVEAYLALALTSVLGASAVLAGGIIALAAISWTGGTWLQDRLDDTCAYKRQQRTLYGSGLLVLGIALQIAALYIGFYPLVLSLVGWMTAGLGIGLAHTATLALIQGYTPGGSEGTTSASMYLFEQLAFALSAGVGGALLAFAPQLNLGEREGLLFVFILSVFVASCGLVVSRRLTVDELGVKQSSWSEIQN